MKKITSAFLTIILLCLFLGPGMTLAQDKVTLDYMIWDPGMVSVEKEFIESFEEKYPNINVNITAVDWGGYWQKLPAMSASGDMPDVFYMSAAYVDEWAKRGQLANIQSFVDQDIDPEDYYSKFFESVRFPKPDGPMYAFPFAWVDTALHYNKDMFDKAGLEDPQKDWNWFDFLNAAEKLTKDTDGDGEIDQWGFWMDARYQSLEPFVYSNGGRFLSPDKTDFVLNENEKALQALEFYTDLVTKYRVAPPPKRMEGTEWEAVFNQGKAAMWVSGSFDISDSRKRAEFKWDISTIPIGPQKDEIVGFGWPDNLAMAKGSDHKEEAWNFMKFMAGPARTVDSLMAGKASIYKEITTSEEWLEEDKMPAHKEVILELGRNVERNTFTPGWGEWRPYLTEQLRAVLNGEMSLDEALEKSASKATTVLNRFYED